MGCGPEITGLAGTPSLCSRLNAEGPGESFGLATLCSLQSLDASSVARPQLPFVWVIGAVCLADAVIRDTSVGHQKKNMKTGFSNLIEPNQGPTLTEQLEVGGMIMAFMKNSMKSAAVYVSHSGRSIVTPKDIQMAMKWEVFEFYNRHTLLDDINEMTRWTMENCEVSTDGLFDKDDFGK